MQLDAVTGVPDRRHVVSLDEKCEPVTVTVVAGGAKRGFIMMVGGLVLVVGVCVEIVDVVWV